MALVAVTRLRLRSLRFTPALIWLALRSQRQARGSGGCLAADVRTIRGRVFWTKTAWRDEPAMRAFMLSGAHAIALRKLPHWCDEASLVHWEQASPELPDWSEAEARLRASGRTHARGETLPGD
jgi:hypothetical protein